ncbi:hypothetical protein DPMN_027831 [Dreissena polymorpha]|uniref:Uncharacterized protein n=1 Tax=Dreissena polymorpha TaxID=45954 RepID=A0A9D4LV44_DREPO|nr:hypothetical protein DPMN_027831 [Dreissena polymorpha]
MYAEQKVEFLINDCDHVAVYENQGLNQSEPSSEEERERQVLGSMNRVQQIEMVQGVYGIIWSFFCNPFLLKRLFATICVTCRLFNFKYCLLLISILWFEINLLNLNLVRKVFNLIC